MMTHLGLFRGKGNFIFRCDKTLRKDYSITELTMMD